MADARVPYSVHFEWTGVPGAAAYQIQVAQNERFVPPLAVNGIVQEPHLAVELPVIGRLWWRVRSLDARGNVGPWSVTRRFEVSAPPLAGAVLAITLTPASVTGGEPTEGLVTLLDPAPAGGATVRLSVSDPAKLQTPSAVLLPAGRTTATFRINTAPVAAEANVMIVAASRSDNRMATLTIRPPGRPVRLVSFAVNPAILTAGNLARGTIALSGPASWTTTVQLSSSDNSRVSVPATVTIPAGAFAANFVIQTTHDVTPGAIDLTASLDGASRTAAVQLRGAGTMAPLPAPVPYAPAEGAAAAYRQPVEFAWSEVPGAASYTLEIDDGNGPSPLIRTVPGSRLSLTLAATGPMWWHVRANDAYGAGGRWSTVRALRVR